MLRLLRKHMTKFRLALGLTSITVSFMLLVSFLPILPNADQLHMEAQRNIARVVAANGTLLISQNDIKRMEAVLHNIIHSDTGIVRAEILDEAGETLVKINGDAKPDELNKVSVPIWRGEQPWGSVDLYFPKLYRSQLHAFYQQPLVRFILLVASACFLAFFFYLGRMLKILDPSQAIPERVRSALDTMAEGLLVLDARNNIVLANQAFAEIVGENQGALIGANSKRFNWLHVDGREFDMANAPWSKALKYGQAVISERIRLRLTNGLTHTFMVNCSPVLGSSGNAGGVLVSFDDVTQLEQQELELIRSKEEAEIANQSKSDFLANMSHEIRTPMTAIMGFTEVLRRGYGNGEKSAEYLETINKNSRHLLELINDILDLSKVESGQIDVENVPTKVHEIIRDVIEVLAISAKKKHLDLCYEPQSKIPEQVVTDPARVRQIITNLIGNAIKFTQSGSVTVRSSWHTNNIMQIDVIDTGIGMSEQQQAKVFEPFVQADSSITRRFGGTGLGLTISKRYASALGGDISLTSQAGKGSCFTLNFAAPPITQTPWVSVEQQLQPRQQEQQQQSVWKLPKAKILVVDDSDENRDLIELLLQNHGQQVVTLGSAIEALKRIPKETFDLILMDVQMPGMDGYSAVKRMRHQGIKIPIFALTAHAMKGIEQKCIDAGYTGYIAKPIKIDNMIETLAKYIGGVKIPVAEISKEAAIDIQTTSNNFDSWTPGETICSSLQNNPKYLPIIGRFVNKLQTDLQQLEIYFKQNDFVNLAELAHKLKGSAGTVGFYTFTEPFHRLEITASTKHSGDIKQLLKLLKDMVQHIDRSQLGSHLQEPVLSVTTYKAAP